MIAASNAGADKPPLWYLNSRNCPDAAVQVRDVTHQVVAREASGEKRARLWNRLTELHLVFAAHQSFTERPIPVIILRPVK